MSNIFQNLQLQRIADAIENGQAGGEITIDVTGAGDMQGATASTAGVHGLVPAPQAGDEDKFLTGAGTFASPSGGEDEYSTTEHKVGKWIDGSDLYECTFNEITLGADGSLTLIASGIGIAFLVSQYYTDSNSLISPLYTSRYGASGNCNQCIEVVGDALIVYNLSTSTITWTGIVRYTKTV